MWYFTIKKSLFQVLVKNIYKYLKTTKDMIEIDSEFIYIYEFKNFAKLILWII